MRFRSGVAIDLGTVNTLVYVVGRGIVIDEPSAIAISRDSGAVVAVGQEADALTGKEPQGVEIIHPLRDGVIADLEATVAMLQAFLRRARASEPEVFHFGDCKFDSVARRLVRDGEEVKLSPKEIKLAEQLVDSLSTEFDIQKYHDEFETRLRALIAAKEKGREVAVIPHPKRAPVIDMMSALKKSLAKSGTAAHRRPMQAKPVTSRTKRTPRRAAS